MLPPAIFFPPGFVRQEFPGLGLDADPRCPSFRCPPVPEGCGQSRVIMINGRSCPFCPRNICTGPDGPQEQLEGNRLVISTESGSTRGGNTSPTQPGREAEPSTGSSRTGTGGSGPVPRRPESPFFAPNERRVVRGGRQGVRGRRVDRPVRRRPGTSSRNPQNRPNRDRAEGNSVSQTPRKLPQVENQLNAHDLFPLEPFRDNIISDTEPKQTNKPKPTPAPKPPVTPAPTKAPVTPAPTHGTRQERQTRPAIRFIFQALQDLGSNANQANARQTPGSSAPTHRGSQTPLLPPFRSLPGSPFTRVVQQGSRSNGQNSNPQPSSLQGQTAFGIHPLLPLFLMQQSRLNNPNAPTPSVSPNAPQSNAAQNSPSRNNAPNLQQLPPHLRGMWQFPMFNPGANQNAIPGMKNNAQTNQAGATNAEPSVSPVSPAVQADINQWMEQMAMPIQQELGDVSPSNPNAPPPGGQPGRQITLPNQANQQPPPSQGPNQAHLQQWFQQMALQRQRLTAGQAPPAPGFQQNQIPPIPTLNQLFQNQGAAGRTNAQAPNVANPASTPQANGANPGHGFSQWLDSLAQQISQQIVGGSNPVPQPNANRQMLVNNMFPNMNNMMQNVNNAPAPSGGGGQVTFNNWLENMVSPIQQELTVPPGSPQAPSSGDGTNLEATSWFNEMLNPIQMGLGGV